MAPWVPAILCPVDFSKPSQSALWFAAAIADHFGARLTVLTVDDPLLAAVADASGRIPSLLAETDRELRRFCDGTLENFNGPKLVEYRVRVGKPATEILRTAAEVGADGIVISSHGRSGLGKMFFGSTTERVLRETSLPVLVTPDEHPRATSLSEIASHMKRVVAPVDLTAASAHQVAVAGGIAQALSAPLILVHVLEPIHVPHSVRLELPGVEVARRAVAEERMLALLAKAPHGIRTESLLVTGNPSEELVQVIDTRRADVVVMGLHSSGGLGPRMGSVTYRVVSVTHALVVAIPPSPTGSSLHTTAAAV